MTIQRQHLNRLKTWANEMAGDDLTELEQADLRSMWWAIQTLESGVDAVQESALRFRETKAAEFEDRRQERRAKQLLRDLLHHAKKFPVNPSVLNAAECYLREKDKLSAASRPQGETK